MVPDPDKTLARWMAWLRSCVTQDRVVLMLSLAPFSLPVSLDPMWRQILYIISLPDTCHPVFPLGDSHLFSCALSFSLHYSTRGPRKPNRARRQTEPRAHHVRFALQSIADSLSPILVLLSLSSRTHPRDPTALHPNIRQMYGLPKRDSFSMQSKSPENNTGIGSFVVPG